jgi:hypothetical protein
MSLAFTPTVREHTVGGFGSEALSCSWELTRGRKNLGDIRN